MSRLAAFRRSVADAEAALELYLPLFERYWAGQVRRMSRAAVTNLYAFQPLGLAAAGEPPFSMPDPDEVLHLPTERVIIAASVAKHWDAIMAMLVEMGAESGISFAVRNRIVREVLTDRGQHITGIVETVRAEVMTQLQDSYDHGESLRKASRRVATAMGGASKRRATVIARTELTGAVNGASVRLAQVMSGTSLNSDGSVRQDTLGHDPVNLAKRWYATPDRRTRPTHARANGQVVPIAEPFDVGGASLMYPGDPSGPGKEVIMCRCAVAYEEMPVTTRQGGKLAGAPLPVTLAPSRSGGLTLSSGYAPSSKFDASLEDVAAVNDRATGALRQVDVAAPADVAEPDYAWDGTGSAVANAQDGHIGGWYVDTEEAGAQIRMNAHMLGKQLRVYRDAGLDRRVEQSLDEFSSYVTHEYGHHIDESFKRRAMEAELAPAGAINGWSEYQALQDAIDASAQLELLSSSRVRGKPAPKHINEEYRKYLMTPEEKFARAFQQWVATESGDDRLMGWVRRDPTLWNRSDFEQIRAAMTTFLRSTGWLTT